MFAHMEGQALSPTNSAAEASSASKRQLAPYGRHKTTLDIVICNGEQQTHASDAQAHNAQLERAHARLQVIDRQCTATADATTDLNAGTDYRAVSSVHSLERCVFAVSCGRRILETRCDELAALAAWVTAQTH